MGNETSQLSGLNISEKAIEHSEFWVHHHATIVDQNCSYFSLKDGSVSVFKGSAVSGPLWAHSSPLEKCSNNLLKYRHPAIIRYISAWQQRSVLHLATDYVQPLSLLLPHQSPLQILIGLNNILQALVFLHQQAGVSHNNVCIDAVYVTAEGNWKLGGLQFLCPFKEITSSYLKMARPQRYERGVDPDEDNQEVITKVDHYAFATLVEDVFKNCSEDQIKLLTEFKTYCKERLQCPKPSERPALADVMQHEFFNHRFVSIYKFLSLLPLKTAEERTIFFKSLLVELKEFDEETVAKQLAGLLLARVTLLDSAAQENLLSAIFSPRNDLTPCGLFSESTFREYVKPRLVQIFGVHDLQIRLLLLNHFPKYVSMFTHEELANLVLPELLLGIKDTDDKLVSATLVSLSELVPILGATTVIGGKRKKIFSDGRPNQTIFSASPTYPKETKKSLRDFPCSEEISESSNESFLDNPLLLERPAPVGGESFQEEPSAITSSMISHSNVTESEETWSDWDKMPLNKQNNSRQNYELNAQIATELSSVDYLKKETADSQLTVERHAKSDLFQKAALEAKSKKLLDISELDIKTQKLTCDVKSGEIDFFADMTPIIETKCLSVPIVPKEVTKSKLDFVPNDDKEAWGDEWDD